MENKRAEGTLNNYINYNYFVKDTEINQKINKNCSKNGFYSYPTFTVEKSIDYFTLSIKENADQKILQNILTAIGFGLHPTGWTKYDRVVGRNQIPFMREKGTCHEAPKELCC